MALRLYIINFKRQCGYASMSKDRYIGAQGPTSTTTVADGYWSGYKDEERESEASLERGMIKTMKEAM